MTDANRLTLMASAVEAGDDETVVLLVREALAHGMPAARILNEGLVAGMESIGESFGAGDVFLPEILVSAEALNAGVAVLEPHLLADGIAAKGRVVIGTVAGDVHSIGKNLVALLLRGNGFEVHDLGVDVSEAEFVAAVRDNAADILALSSLLSATTSQFAAVVDGLERAGLRARVGVLVGGAPVTPVLALDQGADGYAEDCVAAVAAAARLMAAREET
ncbi:MAG: cobalamin-dependent protein [Thermoleophilia bacterium]